jgi:hypothetical protein
MWWKYYPYFITWLLTVTVYSMTWLTVTVYLCYQHQCISSVYFNHNPVITSRMTDHRVCIKSKTTGATSGGGITYPFESPEFTPVFGEVCVDQSFVFYVVFCIYFIDCLFFFWSLHCVYFFDLRLQITPYISNFS